MKITKIIAIICFVVFTFSACKSETKKKPEVKEVTTSNPQKLAFNISGMTCEIGCAKTIQSKLSKKSGITSAKVVFTDSIALVEFDANTISKKEITSFVDGIAGGDMYKTTNSKSVDSFEDISKKYATAWQELLLEKEYYKRRVSEIFKEDPSLSPNPKNLDEVNLFNLIKKIKIINNLQDEYCLGG